MELFVRLGIFIEPTEEEAKMLLDGKIELKDLLKRIIEEKRFSVGGDTYLPETQVEDYNAEHGTDYDNSDIGFEDYDWVII